MGAFLDSVPFSGIIRIRDMMYTVKDPFRLDQGDVSFDAPDTVKEAMHRAIDENRSHYLQTTGVPRLLDLLAEKLRTTNGIPVGAPDEVMVTTGGIHALYIICQALLEPGDEVIVPDPEWPPAVGNMMAAQGVPVPCPLHEHLGWRYDLDELASKITPKTRAIYVNSPSNPTGGVLTRDDIERIVRAVPGARPLADLRRSLRRRRVRGRTRQPGVPAGRVRPHGVALHVQQVLRDDGASARLRRGEGCGAARPDEEGAVLHRQQRRVGRAVRRDRRARRIAGLRRRRSATSSRRGGDLFYNGIRDAAGDVLQRRRRRPERSTRSCRINPSWTPPADITHSSRSWAMTEFLISRGTHRLRPGRGLRRQRRRLRPLLLCARPRGTDRRARIDANAVQDRLSSGSTSARSKAGHCPPPPLPPPAGAAGMT